MDTLSWLGDQWWFWVVGIAVLAGLIVLLFYLRSQQGKED